MMEGEKNPLNEATMTTEAAAPTTVTPEIAANQASAAAIPAAPEAARPPAAPVPAPESASVATAAQAANDATIVPTETRLPAPKPVVNTVAAPAPVVEAANDPLRAIVQKAEKIAAEYIADRAADQKIDMTGKAAELKIVPIQISAPATGHPCSGAGCQHCAAPTVAPAAAEVKAEAVATPAKMVDAPVVEHAQGITAPAANQDKFAIGA